MSARPRVALIGCGRIGQVHLRTLLSRPDLCDLALIADASEDALRAIESQYGVSNMTHDVDRVFSDGSIEAVIIASSTETHTTYISRGAAAGKAIFTEKPIALDLDQTESALHAVERAGVQLQVGFQRRFDSGYAAAYAMIASGELGPVEMIRDAMRDPEPPPVAYLQRSGGLYRDMTIHNFDCIRWFMGVDPVEMYAMGSALTSNDIVEAGDIDTSVVTLRFPSGALASIENSRRSGFGYDVRTEIFGRNGGVFIGESRQTPLRRFDGTGVHEDHQYFFLERFADAYQKEIIAFLDAVSQQQAVKVTGEDGRKALELALAAERSRQTGRPVRLDQPPGNNTVNKERNHLHA